MKTNIRRMQQLVASLLLPLLLAACSFIDEDADECTVRYQVQFVDDMNLNFADAFSQEVSSITLYVFDRDSTLVWSGSESGSVLSPTASTYAMEISHLTPGDYHLVAWGGLVDNNAFSLSNVARGQARMSDLTCTLARHAARRTSSTDTVDEVSLELDPIFHGMTDITIPAEGDPGMHTFKMTLLKNTNNINVLLQQHGGRELNPDDYEFVIEADNGHLNYDNSLLTDERPFVYTPWLQQGGEAYGDVSESIVLANLTVSRLVLYDDWTTHTRPTLSVYNRLTGATVLSIPLLDYALMVRSRYPRITSGQEYLDRQDDYNFTFILTDGRWVDHTVVVNSWKLVLSDEEFGDD